MIVSTIDLHPQRDEIIAAIKRGESLRAIASQFNVSKDAVARFKSWLPMKRTPEPKPEPTPEPKGTDEPMIENAQPQTPTPLETARQTVAILENELDGIKAQANSLPGQIAQALRNGNTALTRELRVQHATAQAELDGKQVKLLEARADLFELEAREAEAGLIANHANRDHLRDLLASINQGIEFFHKESKRVFGEIRDSENREADARNRIREWTASAAALRAEREILIRKLSQAA